MCRIFGFRSVIQSQVHTSLIHAENALGSQSTAHPDGWGVAYYLEKAPHVIKSEKTAIEDRLFQKVSGLVSSQTVIAHLRRATQGDKNILNTHPFQYGPWIFAHNGHLKNLELKKTEIKELINENLKKFILGDTDSELIFYVLLSEISKSHGLSDQNISISDLSVCMKSAVKKIISITGPCDFEDSEIKTNHNYLTFVLTNGDLMLAHQGGQPLYYSTYKTKCSDSKICAAYSQSCEAVSVDGVVNHLIFSSEPLSGENIWLQMAGHKIVGVDKKMKLFFSSIS